jgi:small nuclear ribonucleoprotein
MSERPLDVLEEALDAHVTVRLKDGTTRVGVLSGYDKHMNVVLEPTESERDAVASTDEGEAASSTDEVGDTTIIRGDNVVSISL